MPPGVAHEKPAAISVLGGRVPPPTARVNNIPESIMVYLWNDPVDIPPLFG